MAVSFEQNRLTIDSGTIELEKSIQDVKERPGRVIVLFDDEEYASGEPGRDRNVIAVDRNGAMLWRIAPSMSSTPSEPGRTAPFVGVDIENRGGEEVVIVYDIMGSCYDLDSETGKLSNPVLTK